MRIAQQFGALAVLGTFDDALPQRLGLMPSSFRNMPNCTRVFGTALVSTTRIHGVHFIEEKIDRRRIHFVVRHVRGEADHVILCSPCADRSSSASRF